MSLLPADPLTRLGVLTARPEAFLILLVYVALWPVFDPASLDWHGAATIATWAMTLFIQRAEHRDTQAVHAKLDELLRATASAHSDLASIDQKAPEEIEDDRERALRTDPR
jgi:low affinity Fe/Cu permease